MSKNHTTDQIIPQLLNDRLVYLRKEWQKNKNMREKANEQFKPLKELVYFLITVDKQPKAFIADLLDVSEPRIQNIMREFKNRKAGDIT